VVISLHARIQLVPPTLSVIAALITNKKSLHYVVAQLEDRCYQGASYSQLMLARLPLVKFASGSIGHGLSVAYTETLDESKEVPRRGLVWVSEVSCHHPCAILGRICQGEIDTKSLLEKIEKKHREWFDKIPSV